MSIVAKLNRCIRDDYLTWKRIMLLLIITTKNKIIYI